MDADNVIPFPGNPGPTSADDLRAWVTANEFDPFGSLTPPELLPKRSNRAAFTVRLALNVVEPPVWRRLRLASDLTLDQLHDIVQDTMGWTDSHLHHFVMGPDSLDCRKHHFLAPFDIEEGDDGIPENEVRLDQTIGEPGHRLFYEYDFGDGWWHTLELEKIEPWQDGDPIAFCLAGERACPPEDSGGPGGFGETLEVRAGNPHGRDPEWVEQILTWLPYGYDPERFSADEVNLDLAAGPFPSLDTLHPMVTDLLSRSGGSNTSALGRLIKAAAANPVGLTDAELVEALRSYRLLMQKVGDGIALTKAGYLPPRIVEELYTELSMDDLWIGKGNREDGTLPVLELRESATALGLLRRACGHLTVTAAGRKLVNDPHALWRHIASRLPMGKEHEKDAGTLALLFMAAGHNWYHVTDEAGDIMEWLGWQVSGSGSLSRAVYQWSSPPNQVIHPPGGRLPGPARRTAIAREILRNPAGPQLNT